MSPGKIVGFFGWRRMMETVGVGQAAHTVRNCEMKLGMVTDIWILLLLACAHADPGYDHLNRDVELDNTEGIIDVESTEPLVSNAAGKKQLRLGKPLAGYADYDYYMSGRRPHESSSASAGADNEQSGSSAIRVASGEPGLRRSVDEMNVKSLPWYGPYTGKSIAMYPSRSYDPYIRRYDR